MSQSGQMPTAAVRLTLVGFHCSPDVASDAVGLSSTSRLRHATSINNFAAVTASKAGKIESLDEEWQDGHKRQIEIYRWCCVSDTGYRVYANASKDKTAFDWKLEFDLTLVPYTGDDSWEEGKLKKIKECLDSDALPDAAGGTVGKELRSIQTQGTLLAVNRKKATLGI